MLALAVRSVSDLQGNLVAASSSSFSLDSLGPRVISSSVQQGGMVAPGNASFTIQFDEPINTTNIGPGAFWLFHGDSLSSPSPFFTFSSSGDAVTISYMSVAEGHYTLRLDIGITHIQDLLGNALDGETPSWPIGPNQSGDGVPGGSFAVQFTVDADTLPFPAPQPDGPNGSLAYTNVANRYVDVGDQDSFTIKIAPAQTLTARIQTEQSLQVHAELFDPQGSLIVSSTAPAGSTELFLGTVPVIAGGTYTIRLTGVNGSAGLALVFLSLNRVEETEHYTGISDDTLATAQDLDPALTPPVPGSPARRIFVEGYFDGISGDPGDFYRLSLDAGDTLTALSGGISVIDPDGNLICQDGKGAHTLHWIV